MSLIIVTVCHCIIIVLILHINSNSIILVTVKSIIIVTIILEKWLSYKSEQAHHKRFGVNIEVLVSSQLQTLFSNA